VPLDEALAQVAVDLSGRAYSVIAVSWSGQRIGELPSDLVEHFLQSLAHEAKFNLNARVHTGVNDHHKAECLMKALGRALCAATRIDDRRAGQTPSTKEALG
jgi:imidazoleglycerol-phosphate dehydratase